MTNNKSDRYLGKQVITKVAIPLDRRGVSVPGGTSGLFITQRVGTQHFHLAWVDGRRAASRVHYSKLRIV